MTKQEQSALKMAGFIKSQTLLLLEKLDQLELDSCADECEELHELAEELYLHLSKELEKMSAGLSLHDGFFKKFLGDLAVARDFLDIHLLESLRQQCDLVR